MKKRAVIVLILTSLLSVSSFLAADEYLIKPGDILNVIVLGEADLTRRVVVSPQGSVTLPLVQEISVAGMTTTQAAEQIAGQIKRFVKNPQVSVELAEAGKIQITVSGEVRNQGLYTVPSSARLMDAITAAGGYTPTADLSKVTVSPTGSSSATTVDLSKFLLSGDATTNVALSGGDTIFVPGQASAAIGSITVLGAVRQSGQHSITQGMTAREAIMLAGGPTEFADLGNVTLRREGSSAGVRLSYANADAGDPSANPELRPGDVIYVAAQQALGSYTIQGAVANPGRYELKGETSITEAIAIAGGVKDRARLGDVRVLRSGNGERRSLRANVSNILVGKAENMTIQDQDNIFVPQGKEKPDFMRVLSLALSLGWLLTRN